MSSLPLLISFLLLLESCFGQVTKREYKLLSRHKRYLTFPTGSNFVMTMSLVKSVMVKVPTGINLVGECDVPFSLPSDTRIFKSYKRRVYRRQKRDIFNQLKIALDGYGLNGYSCVKRMICEAEQFIPTKGKSLVKEILYAVFKYTEDIGHEYINYCHNSTLTECDIPLLSYIVGSLTPNVYV